MKKFLIISAIFAISAANLFAQNEGDSVRKKSSFFQYNMKEKISYEIRAGLNFNHLSADLPETDPYYEEYCGTRTGFNLGLFANLPFLTDIDFQTGLAFITKGGNWLYCFELPLYLSYKKEIMPNLKWNVKTGFYIDLISGSYEYDNGEFGIIFATGFYFKKMYFGIQYDLGLTDVYRGTGRTQTNGWGQPIWGTSADPIDKGYTRTFSIELGYRF